MAKVKRLSELQQAIIDVLSKEGNSPMMSAAELARAMRPDRYVEPHQLAGPLGGLRSRKFLRVKRVAVLPLCVQYVPFPHYRPSGIQFTIKPHYYLWDDFKRADECYKMRRDSAKAFMKKFSESSRAEQNEILQGGKSHG